MIKSQACCPGTYCLVGRAGPAHEEQCGSAETLQERCGQCCGILEEGKGQWVPEWGWGIRGTAEKERRRCPSVSAPSHRIPGAIVSLRPK